MLNAEPIANSLTPTLKELQVLNTKFNSTGLPSTLSKTRLSANPPLRTPQLST